MNVKINISTTQYDKHRKIDSISINTVGTLHEKNNDIYLMYKEKNEDSEVTTSIKISKKQITIKRFGQGNSTMIFEQDKVYTSNYRTPYGIFLIETHTKYLNINIDKDNHIKIDLDYNIKMNDIFNGRNKIAIDVEKVNV